jgi:hypothetical protein
VLTDHDCDQFVADGFLALRGVVTRDVTDQCVKELKPEFVGTGVDPDDPSTWLKPVVRVNTPITESFVAAGTQPRLYAAYDRLVGENRWRKPGRLGANVPVRFPSVEDPGDAGWHIDHSFSFKGESRANVFSAQRALLCLYLLTDVTLDDAPTEIKIGSHFDAAVALKPFGEEGVVFDAGLLPASSFDRESTFCNWPCR